MSGTSGDPGRLELAELTTKLRALRHHVGTFLRSARARYFDPMLVLDLFERYEALRDELRARLPDFFHDLPVRSTPAATATTDHDGRGYILRRELDLLTADIDFCLEILDNLPSVAVPSLRATREGVFFAGQYFDALRVVVDIVAAAQDELVIIDGYVDQRVLDLLTAKHKDASARILTFEVPPAFLTAVNAFNQQYGSLEVRLSRAFHDRFLAVDGDQWFHFGASIKDAGHRGFMFSRIEEDDIVAELVEKLSSEWSTARTVV